MSALIRAVRHQLFQLTDLLRIVDEYGRPLYVKLSSPSDATAALPQSLMESKTWGEICQRVPLGSFGLLRPWSLSSTEMAFVVLDKPFHAEHGLLNVAFMPLDDRYADDDLVQGSNHINFCRSHQPALSHELWIDPSADTKLLGLHPTGEHLNAIGIAMFDRWRVRFVDPNQFSNMIGGFSSFLNNFRAPYNYFAEWKSAIRKELDMQQSGRHHLLQIQRQRFPTTPN